MPSCEEMKKGRIYECKECGLQLKVVNECQTCSTISLCGCPCFGAHLDGPTLAWEDVPTDKTITVFDPPNGRVASLPSGFSAHLD